MTVEEHPFWHAPGDEKLKTNKGSCIMARAYINNLPPSDPAAYFAANTNYIQKNGSGGYVFGPFGEFEFTNGGLTDVSSLQASTTVGSNTFVGFNPPLPTPVVTPGLYEAIYHGVSSTTNPYIGDLGFSNQRKLVMTGNTLHVVGFGGKGSGSTDKPQAIWYSSRLTSSGGGGTDWQGPYQLDVDANGVDIPGTDGKAPSIAVYTRGGASSQKAIAVAWTRQPITPPEDLIYLTVKEFDECGPGYWSNVIALPPPGQLTYSGYILPVIAPLTVPVTPGSKERYLIGWTLTWAEPGVLESYTVLRGSQSTASQWMNNQNWAASGIYQASNTVPQHSTWPYANLLVNDGENLTRLNPGSFVTVTSNESNWNGNPSNIGDASQEIAFTGDGKISFSGTWAKAVENGTKRTAKNIAANDFVAFVTSE